jgi:hypothetical protein
VRDLLGQDELDGAVETIDILGGIASPHREVSELARQVAEAVRDKARQARDEKSEKIRSALATARELLTTGRPEAALAACQKALRVDRNSEEARELKAEIDAVIASPEENAIDTGVFPLEETPVEGTGQS